jgi:hypothetical protein
MERFGNLDIMIGSDPCCCTECGSPELDDGCTNPACLRARPNSRLALPLAIQQLAIEKGFSFDGRKEGFFLRYLHTLRRSVSLPDGMQAKHAEKPA